MKIFSKYYQYHNMNHSDLALQYHPLHLAVPCGPCGPISPFTPCGPICPCGRRLNMSHPNHKL